MTYLTFLTFGWLVSRCRGKWTKWRYSRHNISSRSSYLIFLNSYIFRFSSRWFNMSWDRYLVITREHACSVYTLLITLQYSPYYDFETQVMLFSEVIVVSQHVVNELKTVNRCWTWAHLSACLQYFEQQQNRYFLGCPIRFQHKPARCSAVTLQMRFLWKLPGRISPYLPRIAHSEQKGKKLCRPFGCTMNFRFRKCSVRILKYSIYALVQSRDRITSATWEREWRKSRRKWRGFCPIFFGSLVVSVMNVVLQFYWFHLHLLFIIIMRCAII